MQNSFWQQTKVLVTGGAGFIGSHVVEKLLERGAVVTVLDNMSNGSVKNLAAVQNQVRVVEGDIRDLETGRKAARGQDVVMNVAAKVGGIEFNRTHQGTMLYHNLMIPAQMVEAARLENVQKFLMVSTACVYSRNVSIPTPESEGFMDEPEPTNGGYGWGKRVAELLARYYVEEFGMEIGIVRPYNCYGPRDHVDPNTSHVIPALIKRVFDGENPVRVWGSGKQTRAFLYVEDMAEGMILAAEKYRVPDAINLGTDEEISITNLLNRIITISGITPKVEFDTTKPDGSPRRNSDNTKAKEKIGFTAKVPLDEGLQKTIEWYRHEYQR